MRGQLEAARVFLLQPHRDILHAAIRPAAAAHLGEAIFGVDIREVLIHHEIDAHRRGFRAAFFAGLGQKNNVAIEREIQPLELQHNHQAGHHVRLVVDRAAPIDASAVARGAERREGPLRRIDRHDVRMAHQQEGALAAVALQSCHQVRPVGIGGECLHGNAFALEHLLQIVGGQFFISGRVARVEPEQRLKMLHRFVLEPGPVRSARRLSRECRGQRQQNRQPHEAPFAFFHASRRLRISASKPRSVGW